LELKGFLLRGWNVGDFASSVKYKVDVLTARPEAGIKVKVTYLFKPAVGVEDMPQTGLRRNPRQENYWN
jgi:hypothetical protein